MYNQTQFAPQRGNPAAMANNIGRRSRFQQRAAAVPPALQPYLNQSQPDQFDADPLTVSATPMLGSNTWLLDANCQNNALFGLTLAGTYGFLLDWLGWTGVDYLTKRLNFLLYAAVEGTAAATPLDWDGNPCAPGPGPEYAVCDYLLTGFSCLRRGGQTVDISDQSTRLCESSPLYRLDGSIIRNESEWQKMLAMTIILQQLNIDIIQDASFGLETLVNFGYTNIDESVCPAMDSMVVDWNSQEMCPVDGATGVTVNGVVAPDGFVLWDVIKEWWRVVMARVRAASFVQGMPRPGDVVFVMPEFAINCFLDCYTCYTVCGGDITRMDNLEARAFRQSLEGGQFGFGRVFLNQLEVPILPHDYGIINADGTFDIYALVRGVGNQNFVMGQYKDYRSQIPADQRRLGGFFIVDDGRILTWTNFDNTCAVEQVELCWRVDMPAPWAQLRITDVSCETLRGPFTSDPTSVYFWGGNPLPTPIAP